MAPHPDYPRTRLYLDTPLAPDLFLPLNEKRAHYLLQVLRMKQGDFVAVFNGRDGEWRASVEPEGRKAASLRVGKRLREQANSPDLWLLAAPLKNAKTEYVLEKATELGISRFAPVRTQFSIADKINVVRLDSIAVEAAEQCERMDVPELSPLESFERTLGGWDQGRILVYGDESGFGQDAGEMLPSLPAGAKLALLIGPEGGFSSQELGLLREFPAARALCMGPRILRADTAAIAGLALIQAATGDWRLKPSFRAQA